MTIFEFNDYKVFLKHLIRSNSSLRGYQTKLAEAVDCQRAFISQVLHGKAQLTADQAIKACQFWQFRELETEYFLELIQYSKAGTQELRAYCAHRLEKLKSEQSELSSKFKSTGKLSEEQQSVYYSSWLFAAIHVLTSVPSYRTEAALSQRLMIPPTQVAATLSQLEKMKLVTKRSGKWQPAEKN
ncbi:MAG TPA: TIGR02147 family protein, partial [Bdellovibrio sp.]|nr:TIGR02147 family protein [Bdellovibrio sp.]